MTVKRSWQGLEKSLDVKPLKIWAGTWKWRETMQSTWDGPTITGENLTESTFLFGFCGQTRLSWDHDTFFRKIAAVGSLAIRFFFGKIESILIWGAQLEKHPEIAVFPALEHPNITCFGRKLSCAGRFFPSKIELSRLDPIFQACQNTPKLSCLKKNSVKHPKKTLFPPKIELNLTSLRPPIMMQAHGLSHTWKSPCFWDRTSKYHPAYEVGALPCSNRFPGKNREREGKCPYGARLRAVARSCLGDKAPPLAARPRLGWTGLRESHRVFL